jgi:pimeloyl-ACP methyl ester carboxylesterase
MQMWALIVLTDWYYKLLSLSIYARSQNKKLLNISDYNQIPMSSYMNIDNYFVQKGTGEPIVFIHGSYATTSTWKRIIEQLSKTHHCIAIKLPGHCGTPDPEDFANPCVETELAIIESVVTQLTDQPIHLVGHSYGGVVALAQALKGSLSIGQLTLFEPVATWVLDLLSDKEMLSSVEVFLKKYNQDTMNNAPYACGQVIDFWGGGNEFAILPTFIKDTMALLQSNNLRHWKICSQVNNLRADLAQLSIPTRIVCGSRSNQVAHAIVNHLHRELPHSKTYEIKDASHSLVTSHVDECLSVLQDTLEIPVSLKYE